MTTPRRLRLLAPCALSLACGGGPLDDADDVRVWATTASALSVYSHAQAPIAVADGQNGYADAECPRAQDDGITLDIAGDCRDRAGREWVGSARVVRDDSGDRTLTLDGFGNFAAGDAEATLTGSVQLRRLGPALHEFEADFVQHGGMTTTFRYRGRVQGDYGTPSLWSGSGHIERRGFVEPTGAIEAETLDELLDDSVCSGQPAAGQTTLKADGQTAVIQYDGATDCDSAHAARLSVDGEDRGQLEGVGCALSPGHARAAGAGGASAGWLVALFALRSAARRRAGG